MPIHWTPRTHTHPCANCRTPVECDGALAQNDDGWPEVICATYHTAGGGLEAPLCDGCLRDEELRHDADLERDGPGQE